MKARIIAAVVLAVALAVAASTAAGAHGTSTTAAAANKIIVWLLTDAQNGWPGARRSRERTRSRPQHPGRRREHPVPELGRPPAEVRRVARRRQRARRDRAGEHRDHEVHGRRCALCDSRPRTIPNSKTWLEGLKASCSYNGKLYCVPYYAGRAPSSTARTCTRQAGIKKSRPASPQFISAGSKLMKKFGKNPNFSAALLPGHSTGTR